MASRIDELAREISLLDSNKQEELLQKIGDLNFQHGLKELSEKYQKRLADEGKLQQRAEEILVELEENRERIAADEY